MLNMVKMLVLSAVVFMLPVLVSASGGLALVDIETGDRHDGAAGVLVVGPSIVKVSSLNAP